MPGVLAGAMGLAACASAMPAVALPTSTADIAPPISTSEAAIERGAEERPPPDAHLTPTAGPTLALPTPTPAHFPEPPAAGLSAGGPWLVGYGADGVVVVNIDDPGRSTLAGPPLWEPEQDIVVGDGLAGSGWIAARTGLRNDWDAGQHIVPAGAIPPSGVGIAIWRLPGMEPIRVIPRFSDKLLAGMGEIRDFDLPFGWQATGPRWKHDMAFLSLLHEDARLFWSPDGRYLAFAAALDGPSADVYVYDTFTDRIRRLTDGPNQAVLLGWSPDSRWILHYEATTYGVSHGEIIGFPADVLWTAAADASQVRRLGSGAGRTPWVSGWLSSNTVLLTAWTGGSSLPYQLWSINLDTGRRLERNDLSFYSAAADPASDTVAVNADALIDSDGGYLEGGLFVIQTLTGELRRVGEDRPFLCYGCTLQWVERIGAFLAYQPFDFDNRVRPPFRFLPSGEIVAEYEPEVSRPIVSPDGDWTAFAGDGLRIYDSGGPRTSVVGGPVIEAAWNDDSSGVYFLQDEPGGRGLKFVTVPGGKVTLLTADLAVEGLHLVGATAE